MSKKVQKGPTASKQICSEGFSYFIDFLYFLDFFYLFYWFHGFDWFPPPAGGRNRTRDLVVESLKDACETTEQNLLLPPALPSPSAPAHFQISPTVLDFPPPWFAKKSVLRPLDLLGPFCLSKKRPFWPKWDFGEIDKLNDHLHRLNYP